MTSRFDRIPRLINGAKRQVGVTAGETAQLKTPMLSKIQQRLDSFENDWDKNEASAILDQVSDLLTIHWRDIQAVIMANEGEISLGIKADLDHRTEERIVQVGMSFSRRYKDQCEMAVIANPDQLEMGLK